MKTEKYNLGIDIGGTKINIGLIDENGKIYAKTKMQTDHALHAMDTVNILSGEIKRFINSNGLELNDISFIGAGVPGTVDIKTGFVDYCPNLHWIDEPVGDFFEKYLGREVKVIQDARAAALSEKLFGAGQGFENMILITIGTGIGGGIIVNNKLFHGGMNTAGEVGHMPIDKKGRQCVCGIDGCLEQYASGSAFIKRAIERYPAKFKGQKTETLFEMAYQNDKDALLVIEECLDDLAFGLAVVVDILSPEAIIVSGGLCEHESLVVKPLRDKVPQYGYFSWTKKNQLKILKAKLGSDAPMIGASALYRG